MTAVMTAVMVTEATATAATEIRLPAEFGGDRDQRGVEQALGIKILNQSGKDAIEVATERFHPIAQSGMHIPATIGDLDEADAVLNEAAS